MDENRPKDRADATDEPISANEIKVIPGDQVTLTAPLIEKDGRVTFIPIDRYQAGAE